MKYAHDILTVVVSDGRFGVVAVYSCFEHGRRLPTAVAGKLVAYHDSSPYWYDLACIIWVASWQTSLSISQLLSESFRLAVAIPKWHDR